MKKFWEQLKPQERRAVAGIGVIFFLVLNYFMVWPRFKEWGANQKRRQTAEENIKTYQAELRHKDEYARKIRNFDSEAVPLDDQVVHFQNYIGDRALENGLEVQNTSPVRKTTYEFYLEQQESIQAVAQEAGLVNFLYSLGSSGSMVRVRNLILNPSDLGHNKLHATVVIVASYQKTTPTPTPAPTTPARTAAAVRPETPATKPAATAPTAPPSKPLTVTNKPGTPNIKRP